MVHPEVNHIIIQVFDVFHFRIAKPAAHNQAKRENQQCANCWSGTLHGKYSDDKNMEGYFLR
jgi:nitrate/TMAO reductase-like tetraheme cytochrome c subunit